MKKLLSIVLILVCVTTFAAAESIDLSGMMFYDLMKLHQTLVAEIMSRPEWKEVVVPGGTWRVGTDIPSGSYCITAGEKGGYVTIKRPGESFPVISQGVRNESNKIGKIELMYGDTVEIENGSVVFSPAIGLGF